MRKRAMVLGLIFVPLATGGAMLLAKNSNQSPPASKATISLPISEDTPSEYSPSETPGFVLAPSDANAEPHDLKQQQSEEQQERDTPRQPNSEDVDSDHAAAEVLFASENTSAEEDIGGEPQHVAASARGWFNSYAFANGRRSNGSGSSGAAGGSSGSAPSADTKSPQSSASSGDEPAELVSEPQSPGSDSNQSHSGDSVPNAPAGSDDTQGEPVTDDSDVDDTTDEETPPQVTPVPYFPPVDERPHVTVPEPSTLMLLGLGLLACAAASRRRRVRVK